MYNKTLKHVLLGAVEVRLAGGMILAMHNLPYTLINFEVIDSTNEEAKRLIKAGNIVSPTVITANTQTAGRGTKARQWASPPGAGLYMTMVHLGEHLSPAVLEHDTQSFSRFAGLACQAAILEVTGISVERRGVNDLYINNCKLGGILVETQLSTSGKLNALITGVGINLLNAPRETREGALPAISLEAVLGKINSTPSLQADLQHAIYQHYVQYHT